MNDKQKCQEVIEIDDKEYSLFLNRQGMISLEKYCGKNLNMLTEKYNFLITEKEEKISDEVTDDTNPFDDIDIKIEDKDEQVSDEILNRTYWILLWTNHKLPISKVEELMKSAVKEYGAVQLIALVNQMVRDITEDPNPIGDLKNLKALKPMK